MHVNLRASIAHTAEGKLIISRFRKEWAHPSTALNCLPWNGFPLKHWELTMRQKQDRGDPAQFSTCISWGSRGVSVFPVAAMGQGVRERCLLLPTTTSAAWELHTTPRWQVR